MANSVTLVAPSDVRSVGGFLGRRFDANRTARLKDGVLSEQFIRLHEEKRHDDWFWLGEQVGKWLDAAAYAGLIARDAELLQRVNEVLHRLARSQEADGYLGITTRIHRNPVRGMELYEMYYVLHGLLVCADLLESDVALETAARLGRYITRTWGVEPGQFPLAGRFPGNGHDGGEGTLILEPIVLLGQQTGDKGFIEWAEQTVRAWDGWLAAYPESVHTCSYTAMKQFAAGALDVSDLRENMHAHTYHMTLLGIAALHNATGNPEYRDIVLRSVDRLANEWIFLTGGMSSGERYIPRRYYHTHNDIEVCPQHTWILLLDQALRWTGDPRYAAEIERDLFNHFLAAQLADGSNWSYMTPLNGRAQEPEAPNCCNASGHRIAGRMPTYLYGLRDGAPAVLMYTQSEAVLRPDNRPAGRPAGQPAVTLKQETDFPSSGRVVIHVSPAHPARFPLYLRIPPYARRAEVEVNGEAAIAAPVGGFAVIEREWRDGDTVRLNLAFDLTVQANAGECALVRGPLVYAYFQDAQLDPAKFHWNRGQYPGDIALVLDPQDVAGSVEELPAGEGLLGPALRVRAQVSAKPPIFASAQANAAQDAQRTGAVTLAPFANQGAIRGPFAVFMRYTRPMKSGTELHELHE
jgi:hypothetical protein